MKQLRLILLIMALIFFTGNGLIRPLIGKWIYQEHLSGNILVSFFLSPLTLGLFPIFPHLSYGFLGAYFGVELARKDSEPKKVLKLMLKFWVSLLSFGLVVMAILLPLGITETWYYIWGYKAFQLGIYFFLFWLGLKLVDFQPDEIRDKRMKKMKPLATVGQITLTIFVFEGTIAVILQKLISLLWVNWNATFGSTFLFGLLNVAVWLIILLIWKKFKFKGSLEHLIVLFVKKLSGQSSSKMKNYSDSQG